MRKIVVKIGSSVIAPSGKLDPFLIEQFVDDILEAEKKGYKIILVSSGAIACGLNKLKYTRRPNDTHSLMALSSLGQIVLMNTYTEKFAKYDKLCAQILLTWDDFDQRKRFINARCTINKLLGMGIIPIINENDAVSCDEIRFGDNDRLSALVGDLASAEKLFILSDVLGLLDKGELVKEVIRVDEKIFRLARIEDKVFTTGGMFTKLEAARISTSSGIKTIIASGRVKKIISRLLDNEDIGTVFLPSKKIKTARKRWIAFSKKIKGRICVDDGAKEAILKKGKSLLGVGILQVEGEFKTKDAVQIIDCAGNILGCGISNYSSELLKNFKRNNFEKEVIHRDNFVMVNDGISTNPEVCELK